MNLFVYLLGFVTSNYLVIYRISVKNEPTNIANLKFSIVSILVGKKIKAASFSTKEFIHQLFCICMNNTSIHLFALCSLFPKKNRKLYKYKYPECNMPLYSVVDQSGTVTVHYCFALSHHTSEILRIF